jgi:four helix bundle protein
MKNIEWRMENPMANDGKIIRSFTDLVSWQEGHKLVIEIYRDTESFPKSEIFGLTNQMRRCVISITSNIAEGFGRQSYKEKVQFYSISKGSNLELQNQLLAARDIGFRSKEKFQKLAEQTVVVAKLLTGLIRKSRELS